MLQLAESWYAPRNKTQSFGDRSGSLGRSGLVAKHRRKPARRRRPGTSDGEGRLARAGQVEHRRYDEGRERPWSEQAVKVACTVFEEKPEGSWSSGGSRAGRGL